MRSSVNSKTGIGRFKARARVKRLSTDLLIMSLSSTFTPVGSSMLSFKNSVFITDSENVRPARVKSATSDKGFSRQLDFFSSFAIVVCDTGYISKCCLSKPILISKACIDGNMNNNKRSLAENLMTNDFHVNFSSTSWRR